MRCNPDHVPRQLERCWVCFDKERPVDPHDDLGLCEPCKAELRSGPTSAAKREPVVKTDPFGLVLQP